DYLALPPPGDTPGSESEEIAGKRRFVGEMEGLRISSPALFDTVFADAQKYLEQLFDFAAEQARKPYWQRTPIDLERDQSQPARLAKALFPVRALVEDSYTPLLARVRLLACHGAVRRFRWEEDKLPPGLDALN